MSELESDANQSAEASSTAVTPDTDQSSTPEGAKPSTEQSKGNGQSPESQPFHEHPRFKALIDEKNQLKQQLAELQTRMSGKLEPKESPVEKVVQKFVKAGMKEDAARLLAESQYELGKDVVEERVAPVERASLEAQNDLMFSRFAESHKDYEEIRPKMAELFNALPDMVKAGLSSSPDGLDLLYSKAKASQVDEELKKAFEKGVQEGYKRKHDKSAVAPSTGASTGTPTSEYTEEQIAKMSLEDYRKHQSAILASRGMR